MPCYNRDYDLLRVLKAYDAQDTQIPFELIAIDDASIDQTYNVLTSYQPKNYSLRVYQQPKNQGQGVARNLGISIAQSELTLFVGDDILPTPDFIRQHLEKHELFPEPAIAILGLTVWAPDITMNSLMKRIDGQGAQQFSYYYMLDGQEYDFRHFYTSNISIKTSFLKSLDHWFDTDFNLYGFEDIELAYRLSKIGLRIRYFSSPLAYHYHYHSIWTFSKRQYNTGLMACLFVKKHPQLSSLIQGRGWKFRSRLWLMLTKLQRNRLLNIENLENQLLAIASTYETKEQAEIEYFYDELLSYFFVKGLIYGTFSKNTAHVVNKIHAQKKLLPLIPS